MWRNRKHFIPHFMLTKLQMNLTSVREIANKDNLYNMENTFVTLGWS